MSDIKQVKIDNWGIFFLQRLQQFFNRTDFCDLTLQFENNVQLKVHRLVMNACTEYFQVLENTCDVVDDCLIMPLDLQPDVVVPIVNFMYTGQLEFQMSNYDKLYAAAKLMNLTVLTKLLDAQKVPVSPLTKPLHKRTSVGAVTWNLQGKKIVPKTMDPDLPEPLPGRKLPVWKRKTIPTTSFRTPTSDFITENVVNTFKSSVTTPKVLDNTPRPTRFEWPEDEIPSTDMMVSSFDDISYGSQPLAAPIIKSNSTNNSSAAFEEIKKTAQTLKRPASYNQNHHGPVNLQDVKEYLQEQKLRNDYILRNEERNSASQNEDSNDNIEFRDENSSEVIFGSIKDDNPNKSILKPSSNDEDHSPAKKVRFSLEGKENVTKGKKSIIEAKVKVESGDLTNHTKIISEVLKKYPHLMQKNKNIKLKIMQKNQSTTETTRSDSPQAKRIKIMKNNEEKIKIVDDKSQEKQQPTSSGVSEGNSSADEDRKEYKCKECNIPNEYIQLQSYPEFHDHMIEFHPEQIDPRVCEHCGHRSTRRHLLVYHQLTKHGINPPPPVVFPQCDICDYIAVNTTLLKRHQTGVHGTNTKLEDQKTSRIVCQTCKGTFKRNLLLIKHCHQTGHNEDINFDCEYCHKKFLRTSYVIAHMKSYHKPELEQDNISLDDWDNKESTSKSEIKIISNIPINIEEIDNKNEEVIIPPSVPSSEAEALVNVASGIAASLGLVVLDENQYVIQDDCTGTEEYIIPEMNEDGTELVHQTTPQTIALTVSDQQTTNSIVTTTTPVTSTDELVMVLTDHDYSDGNTPIITSENSNIVVLYSHPVEGQSTQYISPEGNIVLNSTTGVIEMNGHKLHVTNTEHLELKQETSDMANKSMEIQQQEIIEPEESIEMIQQEIDSHFQVTEKLNQDIIQHANVVTEILSTEDQLENNIAEETAEDLAKTLGDKDDDENVTTVIQNEEQLEDSTTVVSKEHESLLQENTENLEPEPMEVDDEIINDTISKSDCPKEEEEEPIKDVLDNNESISEQPSLPLNENQNESDLHLDEAMDIDETDTSTVKENISADSVEITVQESVSYTEITENINDEVQNETITENVEEDKSTIENVEEEKSTVENVEEEKAIVENVEEEKTIDENVEEEKAIVENVEEEKVVVENVEEEKSTDDNNTEVASEMITSTDDNIETITEQESNKTATEIIELEEVKSPTNDITELPESETSKEETMEITDEQAEEIKLENQNEINPPEPINEKEDNTDIVPSEIVVLDEKSEEVIQPKDTEEKNETIPKDNVTSLVSDWCDDDSGLQGSGSESVQQNLEKEESTTMDVTTSNEFVVPTEANLNNETENTKNENDENKVSNIKITKLLDDWDDGDTDSQNSGENTQHATKNPINNLIEDWDDE